MTGPDNGGPTAPVLEPLLSIEEVSEVLRISERGVYRLLERSELTAVKVGACTRIEPAEVRRYIAEQRRQATERES